MPLLPAPVAVAGIVAVAALSGAVARWRGRRYYHDPEPDAQTAHNLRRLRRRGALGGWLLATVVGWAGGLPGGAATTLERVGAADPLAALVGTLAVPLLSGVLVALAVRLATVPYRRGVRNLSLRYRDVARWELERDGVGLAVVLGSAACIALAPAGWPRVATAIGLGFAATTLSPFALVAGLRTRRPTRAERERVADLLPRGVRLQVVDDRTRVGTAIAAGLLPLSGWRYVFVTESLFDLLDDDELRAVVAHEVGHHVHWHVALRFGVVAVAAGLGLTIAASMPTVALAVLAGGALPLTAALTWLVRRTEYGADRYAARTVGGPALASALERLAQLRYVADASGLLTVLSTHPPLADRIAGLRRPELLTTQTGD